MARNLYLWRMGVNLYREDKTIDTRRRVMPVDTWAGWWFAHDVALCVGNEKEDCPHE